MTQKNNNEGDPNDDDEIDVIMKAGTADYSNIMNIKGDLIKAELRT